MWPDGPHASLEGLEPEGAASRGRLIPFGRSISVGLIGCAIPPRSHRPSRRAPVDATFELAAAAVLLEEGVEGDEKFRHLALTRAEMLCAQTPARSQPALVSRHQRSRWWEHQTARSRAEVQPLLRHVLSGSGLAQAVHGAARCSLAVRQRSASEMLDVDPQGAANSRSGRSSDRPGHLAGTGRMLAPPSIDGRHHVALEIA